MDILGNSLLAFLDVETTGLSPWFGDRICEIGIACCQGDEIIESYTTLVNPQCPISPGASRVNGLLDEDVRDAPCFSDIAEIVYKLLANSIIVCHNVPFDLGFISSEFNRLGNGFSEIQVIDTLSLARVYFDFPSNSLQTIADNLMVNTPNVHRALGDAFTTRSVLQSFLKRLKKIPLDQLIDVYYSPIDVSEDLDLPPLIEEALASNKNLLIHYVDRNGDETRRLITPMEVLVNFDYIYLVAFCHLRDEKRYFRLDRITMMNIEEMEELSSNRRKAT